MNPRRFLALVALAAASSPAFAQANGPGPVSLVLSYQTRLETRAEFRKAVETAVAPQLASWKTDHVVADGRLLFTALPDSAGSDLTLILDFDHFADLERWLAFEQANPGGLAPAAARYVTSMNSQLADTITGSAPTVGKSGGSVFMVIPYTVNVDDAKYRRYVREYTAPQMDAWVRSGVMRSYQILANENPAGAPWGALLVLEYDGLGGLAQRETLKAKVRQELASNPTWKAWSTDKTGIRTELHPLVALPVGAP